MQKSDDSYKDLESYFKQKAEQEILVLQGVYIVSYRRTRNFNSIKDEWRNLPKIPDDEYTIFNGKKLKVYWIWISEK